MRCMGKGRTDPRAWPTFPAWQLCRWWCWSLRQVRSSLGWGGDEFNWALLSSVWREVWVGHIWDGLGLRVTCRSWSSIFDWKPSEFISRLGEQKSQRQQLLLFDQRITQIKERRLVSQKPKGKKYQGERCPTVKYYREVKWDRVRPHGGE